MITAPTGKSKLPLSVYVAPDPDGIQTKRCLKA